MADYAHKKIKLSENQRSFTYHLERQGGRSTHIGVDYGGWLAYQRIVSGLIRKGVLRREGNELVLVEGEPTPVTEITLPKPFVRVRREMVTILDDEMALSPQNVILWMDPRGDVSFHVIIPSGIEDTCKNDRRLLSVATDVIATTAPTAKEAVCHAQSLCAEYLAINSGSQHEVIHLEFTLFKPDNHQNDTGLTFHFTRKVIHGQTMFYRMPDGGLRRNCWLPFEYPSLALQMKLAEKKEAIIDYTDERFATLDAMRMRLADLAVAFRDVITNASLAQLIDSASLPLLPYVKEE